MKTFATLFRIELKLSLRGMDMIIFALGMPVVVLVILGMLYGDKPAFAGAPYRFLDQSFGAGASIAICAGGMMGLPLVVSDYRSRQILKRLRVTPVHPAMILFVQVAIQALYALVSLLVLLAVATLFFDFRMRGNPLLFVLGWLLVLVSMYSIGMMVGGISRNTKTAGIIASILYFPMLVFSGATLPYEVMPPVLQQVVQVLPLTQGIHLLKASTLGLPAQQAAGAIVLLSLIALACTAVAIRGFKWESGPG